MAIYLYEKYIGYDRNELKYKKTVVTDSVTGNETVSYVERTPEEVEAYKQQKEAEFNDLKTTWERTGIKKCAWERAFDDKKFKKIYLKLVDNRLKELTENNRAENIEAAMVNSTDYVFEKYKIGAAFNFYSVKEQDYSITAKVLNGLSRSKLEKMFYSKITPEAAGALARERLSKSTTLEENVAAIQELQRTHNSRSVFYKIFHPVLNAGENNLIKQMKTETMQKFNISKERLDRRLAKKIDKSTLLSANLYKIGDLIDTYCKENSGKLHSQRVIDSDRQNVADRADDDFIKAQAELNRIVNEETREQIVVGEAANNNEAVENSEPVREDPNIIKVPNNDKI